LVFVAPIAVKRNGAFALTTHETSFFAFPRNFRRFFRENKICRQYLPPWAQPLVAGGIRMQMGSINESDLDSKHTKNKAIEKPSSLLRIGKQETMREQLQTRLEALRKEFETGQAELEKVERQRTYLRETMLRISGAAKVLEELLVEGQPARQNGAGTQNRIRPKADDANAHPADQNLGNFPATGLAGQSSTAAT
jgi:hypothetical protein